MWKKGKEEKLFKEMMENKLKDKKKEIWSYVSWWLYELFLEDKILILEKIKYFKIWTYLYDLKILFERKYYNENVKKELERKYWKIKKI